MGKLSEKLRRQDKTVISLFVLGLLIFILMSILAPDSFLTMTNLQSMGVQFAEFGILSFGMMLAMISGGIDLSLVGIANLAGIASALTMKALGGENWTIAIGILVALVVGIACGLFNGLMIGALKIPAMLVTLCGLQLYMGIGLILTKGPAITGLPEAFVKITTGTFLYIPIPIIIFILVVIFVAFLLRSTKYGMRLQFMGTNETAAKYSGINNLKVTLMTYGTSGFLGAIGGILIASHYNSAKSDYGSSYTLLTLLIVVLGGTNPDGGKGSVAGVTLAILVLQLISSAFNLLRINAFIKTFVWGLILITVMVGMRIADRRKSKKIKSTTKQ